MRLSIIIPTHNPDPSRLQRVLHALAAQQLFFAIALLPQMIRRLPASRTNVNV